ncbi:MAG: hypothetical protein Ct9H300mP21_03280 [Pseudomonadota bacterium]|nr:MAG: hypothetical protein Ct9H300mP21_03280 [Pseudomonadota bacterium]
MDKMGMTKKKFIEDLKLNGLRVLTRVDFNVPPNKDLQITDNGRIKGRFADHSAHC